MLEHLKRELHRKTPGWDSRAIEPIIASYGGREAFVRHHITLLENVQRQNFEAAIAVMEEDLSGYTTGQRIERVASLLLGPGVNATTRHDVMTELLDKLEDLIRNARAG